MLRGDGATEGSWGRLKELRPYPGRAELRRIADYPALPNLGRKAESLPGTDIEEGGSERCRLNR